MGELKPGWRRVKFGDLAHCVNDRVDDPSKAGVERYVGLEHLDPESLSIRRWGTPDDVESTKLRFQPGDIIFGKRRAYQRKLAVADFEGICSAHAMVLRAKRDVVLPGFLPFLMQSDLFMERAVAISVGSLSPTINWKTLAAEEFALPPLGEQGRIAELLGSTSQALQRAREVHSAARVSQTSALHSAYPPNPAETRPLAEYCRNLITYGIVQAGPDTPNGVPYIRVSDMSDGVVAEHGLLHTTHDIAAKYKRSELDTGDLVIALRGPIGLTATVPSSLVGANLTQGTARISVRRDWSPDYVRWALAAPSLQARIAAVSKGSTFKEISLAALRELPVPWVEPEKQQSIGADLNAIAKCVDSAQLRVDEVLRLGSRLAARVLGPGAP